MKSTWTSSFAVVTALAVVLSIPPLSGAQSPARPPSPVVAEDAGDEEGTRGAFLTSRPKPADSPAKPPVAGKAPTPQSRRRPPTPKQTPVKGTSEAPAPTAA